MTATDWRPPNTHIRNPGHPQVRPSRSVRHVRIHHPVLIHALDHRVVPHLRVPGQPDPHPSGVVAGLQLEVVAVPVDGDGHDGLAALGVDASRGRTEAQLGLGAAVVEGVELGLGLAVDLGHVVGRGGGAGAGREDRLEEDVVHGTLAEVDGVGLDAHPEGVVLLGDGGAGKGS